MQHRNGNARDSRFDDCLAQLRPPLAATRTAAGRLAQCVPGQLRASAGREDLAAVLEDIASAAREAQRWLAKLDWPAEEPAEARVIERLLEHRSVLAQLEATQAHNRQVIARFLEMVDLTGELKTGVDRGEFNRARAAARAADADQKGLAARLQRLGEGETAGAAR
jgi:hypothetical protein